MAFDTVRLKSVTDNVIVAECATGPLAPVMVIV